MKPHPRESSFMPTIKCSMCAADIEISMMGDHVCGGPAPSQPTPPPDASTTFDRMPYNKRPIQSSSLLKPGRQAPPKVDTGAANRPFFRQEQITPISPSPSRTGSPFQSNDRRPPPLRSATAPIQRPPPSPEFMTGLDSPFPPFPGSKAQSRPRTPQPQQRPQEYGGHGGLGQKAENDARFAPVSPRTATSGGLLQRMNTIAPGPFDPRGRTGASTHQRTKTAGSIHEVPLLLSTESQKHAPKLSTSSIKSRSSSKNSIDQTGGVQVPKVIRKNGYGGFGPPSDTAFAPMPLSPDSRSQTFPRESHSQDTNARRPSEPAANLGSDASFRRPSTASRLGDSTSTSPPRGRRPSAGPDTTRIPPPRGVSLIRASRDARLGDAPPMPSNVNLAAEFGIGNPYHTPSESTSSNESRSSHHSKTSSRSTPPMTSPAGSRRRPSRQHSNTSNIDLLMSEIQSSMSDLQPKEIAATAPPLKLSTSPTLIAATPLPIVNQTSRAAPPSSSYGVQEPKLLPSTYGIQEPKSLPSSYGIQESKQISSSYGVQEPSLLSPDSPVDPAVQGGRLSPTPRKASSSQPPPLTRNATSANNTRRPTTSKGSCKHCLLPIKSGQKSVSSADGRLTGRYHKTCFCCTTCLEPFSTSTFYVINDAPYCEQHYHKLNGSLCNTCDKGIEGQYLESERRQKFHPRCLTCADCRRTLNSDYFEMNGKVFCERDAYRRAQQQQNRGGRGGPGGLGGGLAVPGGTNRMQRRTTRLMMM
ncbi:LIM1 domain-containing protein [Phlyctema vagabunda]|uniref:LIM1 domain-containing protein n=1 Tax=Phlyctema vagabunda TaxID=108571 RepID=A0ABR4PHI6_9HELO